MINARSASVTSANHGQAISEPETCPRARQHKDHAEEPVLVHLDGRREGWAWLLRPGVVFGGLLTTRAHFSDFSAAFGFLLGLMATFVIWIWSCALCGRGRTWSSPAPGAACAWWRRRRARRCFSQSVRTFADAAGRALRDAAEAATMRYTTPRCMALSQSSPTGSPAARSRRWTTPPPPTTDDTVPKEKPKFFTS